MPPFFYFVAITSISTFTSFGSLATSTQALAGFASPRYSLYTSLIFVKSFMSLINTDAFTTSLKVYPASARIAPMFSNDCLV